MGTQNGHNVPFLESASLRKGKERAVKRINQFYKISKKGNKKLCHLAPKVVIDLPFEGRKVEGGWENTEEGREFRRWEVEGKKPSLNRLILALES